MSRLTYAAEVFAVRTRMKLESLRGAIFRTMAGDLVTVSIEAASILIEEQLSKMKRKKGMPIMRTADEDVDI